MPTYFNLEFKTFDSPPSVVRFLVFLLILVLLTLDSPPSVVWFLDRPKKFLKL